MEEEKEADNDRLESNPNELDEESDQEASLGRDWVHLRTERRSSFCFCEHGTLADSEAWNTPARCSSVFSLAALADLARTASAKLR